MKLFGKMNTKLNTATVEQKPQKAVKGYYASLAGAGAVGSATVSVFALGGIVNKITDTFKDIYTQMVVISTVIAVAFIAICLIMRMVSKNQRMVEEATQWIKRIVITWLILNLLSFFVAYGGDLISGQNGIDWDTHA